MKRKSVGLMLLTVVLVAFSGCGKKVVVANAPTGVDAVAVANWYKATGAFSQVADLLQQAEQTLRNANTQGLLPDGPTYQQFLRGFGKIAQSQKSAGVYLRTVQNTFNATTAQKVGNYASDILSVLTDLTNTGVIGIKDANTQKLVSQFLSEINSAIQFALTIVAGDFDVAPRYDVAVYVLKFKEVYVG
jgi:hypothetical protein